MSCWRLVHRDADQGAEAPTRLQRSPVSCHHSTYVLFYRHDIYNMRLEEGRLAVPIRSRCGAEYIHYLHSTVECLKRYGYVGRNLEDLVGLRRSLGR